MTSEGQNNDLVEILRANRDLLLACEIIGWLHMTEKANIDFLRRNSRDKNQNDNKVAKEQDNTANGLNQRENYDVSGIKQRICDSTSGIRHTSLNEDIVMKLLNNYSNRGGNGIVGLLQASHAMASGIEKNIPNRTTEYLQQDSENLWLSSVFGIPMHNLITDPPELLSTDGWSKLNDRINALLNSFKETSKCIESIWKWREGTVGIQPLGWLRKLYTSTLAETRLPNNDVTLFDQSYVSASLFKSAVAGAILEGNAFPADREDNLKKNTQWRLLTIGIGAEHFEKRAIKIGDLTGAKVTIDSFFKDVRKLVEVDLALGSLLYRDGELCIFSFPGERIAHHPQKSNNYNIGEVKKYIDTKIAGYARTLDFEIPPYCEISVKSSRSLVGMTNEIKNARAAMSVPYHRSWSIPGETDGSNSGGHVCPVCLVRSNNRSGKDEPCYICGQRRGGRLKDWLKQKNESDTIWITEVADSNDRVALITLNLDIEPWLNGDRMDSLRAQAIPEWIKENNKNIQSDNSCYTSIKGYIDDKINGNILNDKVLKSLHEGYIHSNSWSNFFAQIVEDRSDAPGWNDLTDTAQKADWLTHQLFRKLPSPGRIYRIERQAEEFFFELLEQFRMLYPQNEKGLRTLRQVIKPDKELSSSSWTNLQVYNGRLGNAPVSLLYRERTEDFLTVFNLARIQKPDEEWKPDCELILNSDNSSEEKKLTISSLEETEELKHYNPIIPIEISPMRLRALVPLSEASECIDIAVEKWKDQFSRVWDRLPLNIGVVAFPRMAPFQAVIESIRSIEDDLKEKQKCKCSVTGIDTDKGFTTISFKPESHSGVFRQETPVTLPDGREDVFYPYFSVADSETRFPLDFRHPHGTVYRHAKDLKIEDEISISPPFVSTLFMDSTDRRFDKTECRYLWEWENMKILWELIKRSVSSRSALRGVWSELVEKREAWQNPDGLWSEGGKTAWLELLRAMFHEHLGLNGTQLESFVDAADQGLLDWCLEWHMGILKEKFGR